MTSKPCTCGTITATDAAGVYLSDPNCPALNDPDR